MGNLDPELVPSRKTYSGWENDRKSPTVAEIQLIAHATKFPAEDFVSEIEDGDNGPDDPSTQVIRSSPWDTDATVVPLRRVA